MLKQLKNLILYDIPPNEDEFLANPVTNLKKLLFDKKPAGEAFRSMYSSTDEDSVDFSSSSSNTSVACSSITSIVNDGHTLGLGDPKIVRFILLYLPVKDLLNARLVNLRWNAVACSVLRSRHVHTRIPPSKLKQFLKLMRNNISNPISSYAIRIDQIREKHTQHFLNAFSMKIVHLRVRLSIRELPEFSKILQKMKNLKDLHLIVFDEFQTDNFAIEENKSTSHIHLPSIRGYHWNSLRVSDENGAWELGLYSFPSVKRLLFESSNASYRIHPFYDQIIANIITACVNLKEMKFQSWNSPLGRVLRRLGITSPGMLDYGRGNLSAEDIVNLFFHLNMRFHQVSLEVTSEITWELLQDVIHKSSESLQELSLTNENIFERFCLTSALRHLIKLRLNLWRGPIDFSYFRQQFPSLRHIALNLSNLYEIESGQVQVSLIEPCVTVKTLTLTRLDVGVDTSLMEKLSVLFPNVKELFIEIKSGKVLEKIYEVYPELCVLCLELNNYSDDESNCSYHPMTNENFTGIPDESIKIIETKDCGCSELDFSEEERSCWNIGCLRNLQTLLIRVPSSVNNIALLEGISRLENLQNLVLLPLYYDVRQIPQDCMLSSGITNLQGEEPTKWCLRAIADNFHRLRKLVTSTEVEYDDSEVEYLRSRVPGLVHKKKQ